ncbi:MAG: GlxA family transcriptional regulator [Shinella sp.]|uniref:GlxA family transcriptional regulator n=1 Tax=Shinella sp. TaxID=1870904 RepID=UPI0040354BD4
MQQTCARGGRFTFYLLDDFTLHAFSAAVEALRLANAVAGRPIYCWHVVTGDGQPVLSACGTRIAPDGALAEARAWPHQPVQSRLIVVCGGRASPPEDRALEAWLRLSRRNRVPLAGVAGGVYCLARTGMADGHRCTVHWEHFPDFSERFFAVDTRQSAYEIDNDLYTCAGGNAPFDMLLRIVEEDLGQDVVNRICELSLSERVREAGERQRLPLQARLGIDNPILIRIVEQMEANLAEPLKLADMTPASGLSRRQMERLFQREMGRSPARYYLDMRLERAHLLLLSSSQAVIEIAMACGFSSASHFSRTYRERHGCTPLATRMAEADRRRLTLAGGKEESRMVFEERRVA